MGEQTYFSVMPSPVGPLTMTASDAAITGVYFELSRELEGKETWIRDDERLAGVRVQLEEYFRGERTEFDLELRPRGTRFQIDVWNALTRIPFGTTVSYGELARALERPDAVRAVGSANGRNQIVIIVPCHRVIGADGSLTGFGGGLPRKRLLLDLEHAVAARKGIGAARGRTQLSLLAQP